MIPVDGVKKLAEKHKKHQVFIYAADHGFNCDQRGSYNAPSAKQARERARVLPQARRLVVHRRPGRARRG